MRNFFFVINSFDVGTFFPEKCPLVWWGQLGSNQRPIGYEPTALTTELCPRKEKYTISGEKIALRKASVLS